MGEYILNNIVWYSSITQTCTRLPTLLPVPQNVYFPQNIYSININYSHYLIMINTLNIMMFQMVGLASSGEFW